MTKRLLIKQIIKEYLILTIPKKNIPKQITAEINDETIKAIPFNFSFPPEPK